MSPALSFDEVSFFGADRWLLHRVSFEIAPGERLAIVGANGAGKSLVARLAAGLLTPSSGMVRVFGAQWSDSGVKELRQRIGVALAEGALLSDLTGEENVRFALGAVRPSAERRTRSRIERVLSDFGAEYCADRPLRELSLGERRRVDLARVFATDPDLLILDTMLHGVDEQGSRDIERRIDRLITRRQRALLLLGSDAERAARLAPKVLRLENGRLVSPPQQSAA